MWRCSSLGQIYVTRYLASREPLRDWFRNSTIVRAPGCVVLSSCGCSALGRTIEGSNHLRCFSSDFSSSAEIVVENDEPESIEPGLYLVGTPIGNLEDISFRAVRVLRNADAILAEDTRHTRVLCQRFGITNRLLSYHMHNEKKRTNEVLTLLRQGSAIALVSDAGTPGISDPGEEVIVAAIEAGITIFPIPGPSAFLTALVASGLPTDNFCFAGFPPHTDAARRQKLKELAGLPCTVLLYAAPHSLLPVLSAAADVMGPHRKCVVARELTKVHEELFRSTLAGAVEEFSNRKPRGEFTLVIEGNTAEGKTVDAMAEEVRCKLARLMSYDVPTSTAAKIVSEELSLPRKQVYAAAIALKDNSLTSGL